MKQKDAFTDRKKDADAARARMLEKFKSRPAADDPAVLEREAARQQQAAAKTEREAARALDKKSRHDAAVAAAENAAALLKQQQEAARLAQIVEREKSERENREKNIIDEAARKAARDARYAARKTRK